MAVAPPLRRFPLCRSSDVEEFTARLGGVYYPADVVPDSGSRFPATPRACTA